MLDSASSKQSLEARRPTASLLASTSNSEKRKEIVSKKNEVNYFQRKQPLSMYFKLQQEVDAHQNNY